jgi:uncharacterized protein YndB with AHSA1/START domain
MSVIEIAPVVKTLTLRRSAHDAFDVFVHGMDKWWPLETHALSPENNTKAVSLSVDRHVGGRVLEHSEDGRAFEWGEVLAYEPGALFAMTWQLGQRRESSGEIEVRFEPTGEASCVVTLVHTGWERMADGANMREGYNMGWGEVFERRFQAHVQSA